MGGKLKHGLIVVFLAGCASAPEGAKTEAPPAEQTMSADAKIVNAALLRRMNQIKECYQKFLKDGGSREPMKLVVRFKIDPSGIVSKARIAKTTFPNYSTPDCVRREVMRVQFPGRERSVEVYKTFVFEAKQP